MMQPTTFVLCILVLGVHALLVAGGKWSRWYLSPNLSRVSPLSCSRLWLQWAEECEREQDQGELRADHLQG